MFDFEILKRDHTFVMGIINVTPDSFFAESRVDEKIYLKRLKG